MEEQDSSLRQSEQHWAIPSGRPQGTWGELRRKSSMRPSADVVGSLGVGLTEGTIKAATLAGGWRVVKEGWSGSNSRCEQKKTRCVYDSFMAEEAVFNKSPDRGKLRRINAGGFGHRRLR